MDFLNTYTAKIHTWGASVWWKGLIVNLGGAVLGMVLTVYGVKYLPSNVVTELTQAISGAQIINATPINPAQ